MSLNNHSNVLFDIEDAKNALDDALAGVYFLYHGMDTGTELDRTKAMIMLIWQAVETAQTELNQALERLTADTPAVNNTTKGGVK
ncbi:hypothetical protein LU293_07345 [Moraxella nasovis]|uniref:hypothetical protein n=1 Tax=Moraxella nasovis TaxID=2904121 RepID=UPI001F60A69C|nr:hypothetical protein [Moraxella nasovis]UNU72902.1 hypothetical protein LU293_07345 [Moraxella nasovis]